MARTRYRFGEPDQPHFLTCTVVEWLPVFTRKEAAQILFDTWDHQRQHNGLKIHGFVLLENHLHAIAQAPDLPKTWGNFKSWTATHIIQLLLQHNATTLLKRLEFAHKAKRPDRSHQFWQEDSHPQQIQGEKMMRQKLDYIHNNPVERGFVDEAAHWRWSSARNYEGQPGVVEICTAW